MDAKFKGKSLDLALESAHCLTKRSIWEKFNEDRLKGLGDMEWTRIEG